MDAAHREDADGARLLSAVFGQDTGVLRDFHAGEAPGVVRAIWAALR